MNGRSFSRSLCVVATLAMVFLTAAPAGATLKFYYDPATGNVSFDTAETRSGEAVEYVFGFIDRCGDIPPWEFRPENMIRLSSSTLWNATPTYIGDSTQATPWRGLYTIGDILPAGLSGEEWSTAFAYTYYPQRGTYYYVYMDQLGKGEPPAAEFIYGPPEGEFVNRWDLVDPDTLTWATTAKLIYRRSGEVLIDTTGAAGGYISAVLLSSNGAFRPDGFTSFTDSPFNYTTDGSIFQVDDAIEPGVYSLGRILPRGLSAAEFEETFTYAQFLGRAGFQGGSFDFVTHGRAMSLVYAAVPEPATAVLMVVACLAALLPLRRR